MGRPLSKVEEEMRNLPKVVGITGILALGAVAGISSLQAAQPGKSIREGQGVVADLGANASAVIYWVSEADGWHVVTTVNSSSHKATDAENHAVARFVSVLQPGESQTISVPAATGEVSPSVQIRRNGERIEVTPVAAQSN
jgi:hypothetical protein